jgi:hypothetical protein
MMAASVSQGIAQSGPIEYVVGCTFSVTSNVWSCSNTLRQILRATSISSPDSTRRRN